MTFRGIGADELTVDLAFILGWELHVVAPHIGETTIGVVRAGEGVSLELYLAEWIDGCAGRRITIEDTPHRGELAILAAEQADGLPYDMVEKHVRYGEDEVSDDVAEVEPFVVVHETMCLADASDKETEHFLVDGGGGYTLKNIDEKAFIVGFGQIVVAHEVKGVLHANLEHSVALFRTGLGDFGLEYEVLAEFRRCNLLEAAIVLGRHGKVDVVVPGDESTMTHSPEKSAEVNPIGEVVLLADAVELEQDFQHGQLSITQRCSFTVIS